MEEKTRNNLAINEASQAAYNIKFTKAMQN